jgi:hypothetical protein
VFVSWMAVAGTGPPHSIELAQHASTASEILFGPVRGYYGEWAITMFNILLGVRHGLSQLRVALLPRTWPRADALGYSAPFWRRTSNSVIPGGTT